MSSLYIETSAVLAWLMGEEEARRVMACVDAAAHVVTSVLATLETERALIRAENEKLLTPAERQKVRGLFHSASSSWSFLGMLPEVIERASRSFPVEPVRSLDAIHLASALELVRVYPDLKVLSLDKKVLANIAPLGLDPAL